MARPTCRIRLTRPYCAIAWGNVNPRSSRLAWLVWGTGVAVYILAIFHRNSLGVAGIQAADRFGINASTLAVLPVLQLMVYAGMQIPVGMVLDAIGPRRTLLAGLSLMTVGQTVFALADSLAPALIARVLLGTGDAAIFISVLRLAAAWFPVHRVSLVTQLTGVLGQIGAIISAAPLTGSLREFGWTTTYLGAAALGVVLAVPLIVTVYDAPNARDAAASRPGVMSWQRLRTNLVEAWREPGTRLGLWTHFTTQFTGTVFTLLWGFPFLVAGQGLSPATASGLLSLLILTSILVGPLLGQLAGRFPFHRTRIALGVIGLAASAWTVVLLWPGHAPFPLLVFLVIALGPTGPASVIGFDHARSFNPVARLGSATGIVNVGGFVASLITILVVGVVLDLTGGYSLEGFRWAFATQYLLWGLGVYQLIRYRRRARATLARRDPQAYEALRRGVLVSSAS